MTYQSIAGFTQSFALVVFFVVFLGAVVYAVWPGNKEVFDHAARIPLQGDLDGEGARDASKTASKHSGGRNGCA